MHSPTHINDITGLDIIKNTPTYPILHISWIMVKKQHGSIYEQAFYKKKSSMRGLPGYVYT